MIDCVPVPRKWDAPVYCGPTESWVGSDQSRRHACDKKPTALQTIPSREEHDRVVGADLADRRPLGRYCGRTFECPSGLLDGLIPEPGATTTGGCDEVLPAQLA